MPQIQFDQFPLQPFLDSLETDGIRLTVRDYERIERLLGRESNWTLLQLRDALSALLVKDEEQQLRFNYRFDQFLQLPAGAEDRFADVEVDKALIDLKELANTPQLKSTKQDSPLHRSSSTSAVQPKKKKRWYLLVYGILCLSMLGSLYFAFRPPPHRLEFEFEELDFGPQEIGQVKEHEFLLTNTGQQSMPLDVRLEGAGLAFFEWECDTATPLAPGESRRVKARFIPAVAGTYVAEIVFANQERSYEKRMPLLGQGLEPIIEQELPLPETPEEPAPERPPWQMYAGLAGFFLFATLLYGFYLWRKYRVPKDEAPIWDENGPRHFPLGSIGGEPPPWLDDKTLDYLADTMGYFQTRWHGRNLDVPASINATLQQGGLPDLVFQRRHEVRSLLILEDRYAEATEWNRIPVELAVGMRRRGIPVIYGTFAGAPDTFTTDDGSSYHLEDFEDERRGILLLFFTDGKAFYGEDQDQGFALEALARWPMAAWMELRDIRFWDESTALSTQYKLPIYPATATGLMQVLHRFLTERGTMADYSFNAANWQPNPILTDTNLTTYLQQFLGDAYLWAADCAMIQPVTPALAELLRHEFHPKLPAARIERLLMLPGTRVNVSGLRFSKDVMMLLRHSFVSRRDDVKQEAIIQFLLKQVEYAKPNVPPDSMAYLAWEATRERVKLEINQEQDYQRLAQLAQTPLKEHIAASLEGYGFLEEEKIPLRINKPKSQIALQRLARLTDSFKIPTLERFPLPNLHLRGLIATGLIAIIFILLSSLSALADNGVSISNFLPSPTPTVSKRPIWIHVTDDQSLYPISDAEVRLFIIDQVFSIQSTDEYGIVIFDVREDLLTQIASFDIESEGYESHRQNVSLANTSKLTIYLVPIGSTAVPRAAATPTPVNTAPSTPQLSSTSTPTPTALASPKIERIEVLPGGAVFVEWSWEGELSPTQNFGIRFWAEGDSRPEARFSITWTKEYQYQFAVNNVDYPPGMYLINVAVMEGPSDGFHFEIARSEDYVIFIDRIGP